MKKIGILTHYYHSKNIGGLLQAYALPVLCNLSAQQAEQISFDFEDRDKNVKRIARQIRQITFRKLYQYALFCIEQIQQKCQNKRTKTKLAIQNNIAAEFEHFIPHSSQKYDNTNIEQANKNYDVLITGSDQVFASYLLPLSAYYGEFTTPDKKVISYAASADRKQFPPLAEKLFIQKLQRLNAISVREKTLKDYIERITDKKATVVLDPTFLLSPQEWLKIAKGRGIRTSDLILNTKNTFEIC